MSHAKCHNELLKAKTVVVMGNTVEAYQTAASLREYLDDIGYTKTRIVLLHTEKSEARLSSKPFLASS